MPYTYLFDKGDNLNVHIVFSDDDATNIHYSLTSNFFKTRGYEVISEEKERIILGLDNVCLTLIKANGGQSYDVDEESLGRAGIIISRSHAGNERKVFKNLGIADNTTFIGIMSSCRSATVVGEVLQDYPEASFISVKGTGRGEDTNEVTHRLIEGLKQKLDFYSKLSNFMKEGLGSAIKDNYILPFDPAYKIAEEVERKSREFEISLGEEVRDDAFTPFAHAEGMPLENPQAISKDGIWDIGEIKKSVMRDAARVTIDKTTVYIDSDLIQQYEAFGFDVQESFVEFLNDFFADEISARPIEQKELVVSVLYTARYLFEDHLANGFIGIHRSLFEKLGSSPKTAQKLLKIGLRHELLHEALFVERKVLIANSLNADEFIGRNRADIKKAMQEIGLWQEVEKRMLDEDIKNAEDMALDVQEIIASGLLSESAPFVAGMVGGSFQSEEIDKKSLQKPPPGTDEKIEQALIDPAEVVRGDGWRPLGRTVSFMREILNSSYNIEDYSRLVQNKAFQAESEKIFEDRKMIPARIDTYIFNQSSYIEQALVELIANAQDASIERKSIGRFGVGFYQIFQELKCPEDSIVVTTSDDGIKMLKVTFSMVDGEVCYEEPEIITENVEKGTKIAVVRSFSRAEINTRIRYAKSHLKANTRGKIRINGRWINDVRKYRYINGDELVILPNVPSVEIEINEEGYVITDKGRGISAKSMFEKLLTPKESVNAMEGAPKEKNSEVREETKIFYSNILKGEGEGIVSIQVSGVINVDIPVFGMNIPREMIIELPHDTWLPESRDDIALDEMTKEGLIAAMKKITDLNRDIKDRYALLNALAVLVRELTKDTEDKTLLYELKQLCGAIIEKERAGGK